ncbi:hypothetical protein BDQ17DRAFT_1419082 [Cyathus striatus]|nr:hypothetical protein BDQ17DRAFT_1419082 [Cyathus striatus]
MLMLQAGDYKSWISIEGKPRPVFRVETTLKSMSCWIPSESNKRFSVNWHNKKREFPVQATVEIDGVTCDDHIMLDAKNYPDRPHGIGVSYTRTSDCTRRDFMFSTGQVTDDDTYLDTIDTPSGAHIGTIKLHLWALSVITVLPQTLQHQRCTRLLEGQLMHERSNITGEHHIVRFGDEYASPTPTVDVVHAYKTEDEPFMTFIFKYRPIGITKSFSVLHTSLIWT